MLLRTLRPDLRPGREHLRDRQPSAAPAARRVLLPAHPRPPRARPGGRRRPGRARVLRLHGEAAGVVPRRGAPMAEPARSGSLGLGHIGGSLALAAARLHRLVAAPTETRVGGGRGRASTSSAPWPRSSPRPTSWWWPPRSRRSKRWSTRWPRRSPASPRSPTDHRRGQREGADRGRMPRRCCRTRLPSCRATRWPAPSGPAGPAPTPPCSTAPPGRCRSTSPPRSTAGSTVARLLCSLGVEVVPVTNDEHDRTLALHQPPALRPGRALRRPRRSPRPLALSGGLAGRAHPGRLHGGRRPLRRRAGRGQPRGRGGRDRPARRRPRRRP